MSATQTLVLSPRSQKVGGALMAIMGDSAELERYTADGSDLAPIEQRAIGDFVADNTKFNTETGVGGLVWLASFHGQAMDRWLHDLSQEYKPEDLFLAVEFLFDIGARGAKGSLVPGKKRKQEQELANGRTYVPIVVNFVLAYREATGEDLVSPEYLYDIVHRFGGLDELDGFDTPARIEEFLATVTEEEAPEPSWDQYGPDGEEDA